MRILAHGDTDGLTSAALVADAFDVNPSSVYFSRPTELLDDLRETDERVAVLDIAIFDKRADLILEELDKLTDDGVLYIDHHPLPEGISEDDVPGTFIHDTERSTAELAYFHLKNRLDRERVKIALYGAIGDYNDETDWVKEEMERWDKRIIYFQAGMLLEALGEARYKYDFKRSVVEGLANGQEPSEMEDLVDLALQEARYDKELYQKLKEDHQVHGEVAYALIDKGSLAKGAHLVMGIAETKVGIVGKSREGRVDMSLRTSKRSGINLAETAKEVIEPLGGSAGGHPAAAGAQVPSKNFEGFIEALADAIKG